MKNEEQSRVYLSRGGKGIIEIKNLFIHEVSAKEGEDFLIGY